MCWQVEHRIGRVEHGGHARGLEPAQVVIVADGGSGRVVLVRPVKSRHVLKVMHLLLLLNMRTS